ncbi:MAG: cell envelope integrity protein TolA [Gammaproteobacteria bacterium]
MTEVHRPNRARLPDRAVLWSLAGHGGLLLLVLVGGIVIHRSPPVTPLAIKATLVDPASLRRPVAKPAPRVEPRPEPKPEPTPEPKLEPKSEPKSEPKPEPKPEPKVEPKPDPAVEQRAALLKQQQADKAREQEKTRQAKAEALAEQQRQAKVAAEKDKAAEAERVKAAREKADAERRKAADAAAARDIERQLKEEERLLAAADSGALANYVALIQQKVERNWVRPPGARAGIECVLAVTQIPGGQVTGVTTASCNADDAVRRSIEAAVLRASPLPMPDDAALFERNLRFTFKPDE